MAVVATRSHGVATRLELLEGGLTTHQIDHRVASGALIPEHRGVFRVGHRAPSTDASYLAAVRACGDAGFLGGLAATWRFGLVKGTPPPPEVIAPTQRHVPGVVCRRSRRASWPTTVWRGIPTLTVPAALVDVAGRLSIDELARACHEAGVRYRTTPRQVNWVLAQRPNTAGAAQLRTVMSGETKVSLSRLESKFLRRVRDLRRPPPVTNRPAGCHRVDCRWPEHRLTVELDGFRFHNSRYSWEQDHRREREAYARGDQFRRYTWGDVAEDPVAMTNELSCLLPLVAGEDRTTARRIGSTP